MNHDPLCEAPNCTRCFGNFAYCSTHQCICEVVRKARADERERIAQRIEGIEHDIFCASWYERDCDCICSETIAAVRGES